MPWEHMASILIKAAELCGDNGPIRLGPTTDNRPADVDEAEFQHIFGTDRPAKWIAELSGAYLFECSYELRALSNMIEAQCVAGTLELLVRAVLERTGRISWVLDSAEETTSRTRGRRAAFEWNVCIYYYRRAIEGIGSAEAVKEIQKSNRDERTLLEEWFTVEKELNDPCDLNSGLTGDISKWMLDGEKYPNYTELAHWVLIEGEIDKKGSAGTYAALSSFSHPNFMASREARNVTESTVSYTYDLDYTERLIRLALFSFCYTLKRWASYYDANYDAVAAEANNIVGQWKALIASEGSQS